MIASLLGILGGFILLLLGVIVGVHSTHITVGILMMFGGLVSMLYFIPENKRDKLQDWKPHE
jgi:heme/copper-type cytochrome/quinol oxidase subunit 3